jgi:hypothetical protein
VRNTVIKLVSISWVQQRRYDCMGVFAGELLTARILVLSAFPRRAQPELSSI